MYLKNTVTVGDQEQPLSSLSTAELRMGEEEAERDANLFCCSVHVLTRNMPTGGDSRVTMHSVHQSTASLSLSSHNLREG